jgi:hypothetical protein
LKPSRHHGEAIAGENRRLIDPENGIYQFDDLVVLKLQGLPTHRSRRYIKDAVHFGLPNFAASGRNDRN